MLFGIVFSRLGHGRFYWYIHNLMMNGSGLVG